jgi:hypothetical protein
MERPYSWLGKNIAFGGLTEKRVSKAVRQVLREKYGCDLVEVSCSAEFVGGLWKGSCLIDGHRFDYRISALSQK